VTTTKPFAALLTALLFLGAACGTDDNTDDTAAGGGDTACASGTISGAGSSFVANIAQQWIKDYAAKCPGATVNYQSVGSGAGIQQFTAGTVDFAASDVAMKPAEQTAAEAKHGTVVHIPWSAGAIAVEYNLDGVDLRLSAETVAGIFAGKIAKWDDAAVKADNPDAKLPSSGIQVVHRSDGSGTTAAFTAYLANVAPSVWTAGSGKEVDWPAGQGAKGSDGVTAAVKQASGAIGYAEVSYAKGAGLGIAKIKNAAGKFVSPEGEAVAAALAGAEASGTDLKLKVNYKPADEKAYPISTPTYVILPTKPADAAKAKLLKAFIAYALTDGQDAAEKLYYAPLPPSLADKGKTAIDAVTA
jgi:phosphate transport system substrate-binding protein